MPRLVQETWVGVGYDVVHEEVPVVDEHGAIVLDDRGVPRSQQQTTLVFVLNRPDGQTVVRVPFAGEAKRGLIAKLTGGIIVANGNGADHLPFGKGV